MKAIDGGTTHSMVLKQDGSVWATGSNDKGQLGDGSATSSHIFVKVIAGGAKAVAAGDGHQSMVLKNDGSVWAAGENHDGRLGDGSTTNRDSFVQVVFSVAQGAWYTVTP